MTITALLAMIIRIIAIVFAAQLVLNIIGTTIYELQDAKRRHTINRHPHARHLRTRHLISVVIVARNNERRLLECLQSVLGSTYRNFEIIIVNNASTDRSGHVAAEFKSDHPDRTISVMNKRVAKNRFTAAVDGFRKYGSGDIVMVLGADMTVDKRALSLSARRFNDRQNVQILTPAIRTASNFSSLGVLQKYLELVGYRSLKWNSAFGSDYTLPDNFACRRQILSSTNGQRSFKAKYANDIVLYAAAPDSIDASLAGVYRVAAKRVQALYASRTVTFTYANLHDVFVGWVLLPLAVLSGLTAVLIPFVIGYILFVAIRLHEPIYMLSAAGTVSLLIIFAVWDDDRLRRKQKLLYTLGIPLVYGPLLVMSIIYSAAIITTGLFPRSTQIN